MTQASLPGELSGLTDLRYLQRKSDDEYSAACPQCGGVPHDGELPDRFIILTSARSRIGKPFAFCRRCGYKWWEGKGAAADKAFIDRIDAELSVYQKEKEARRIAKLAQFTTQELWGELHRRMSEENRAWWRLQGVPDDWQDYLRLGYTPDKAYMDDGAEIRHSAAYTIPYFAWNFVFKTMQYRLVEGNSRYRFETGLGSAYYITCPNQKPKEKVIVCEGAKKAMVVRVHLAEDATVLAVPSCTDWRSNGILDELKNRDVWILFDPDCWRKPANFTGKEWIPQPIQMARAVGKRTKVIELPVKVDDAVLRYGLSGSEFAGHMSSAMRVN